MEEQRNGDEATPEETVDDDSLTSLDDAVDAPAADGEEPASPSDDEGLTGLEEFEVQDEAADTGEGNEDDASQAPEGPELPESAEIDPDAPVTDEPAAADEPVADGEPAPADAAEAEEEGGIKGRLAGLLSINFLSNDVLRTAAVVATVLGIILAGVGLWKLLYSEPIIPEGVEDAEGSADDWTAFDSSSATVSSDTADVDASVAGDAAPAVDAGVEIEPPPPAPIPEPQPEPPSEPVLTPAVSPTEPPTAAEPPPPTQREAASSQPEPWEVWVSPAPSSPVAADAQRLASVPALVAETSAYEQLMTSRRAARMETDASELGAQARTVLAKAFQDADVEFARFLIEDAADKIGRAHV